jgi:hypothetical protein
MEAQQRAWQAAQDAQARPQRAAVRAQARDQRDALRAYQQSWKLTPQAAPVIWTAGSLGWAGSWSRSWRPRRSSLAS